MRITLLIVLLITLSQCSNQKANVGIPTEEEKIQYDENTLEIYLSGDTIEYEETNYVPKDMVKLSNEKYKLWLLELEQKSGV